MEKTDLYPGISEIEFLVEEIILTQLDGEMDFGEMDLRKSMKSYGIKKYQENIINKELSDKLEIDITESKIIDISINKVVKLLHKLRNN